MIQFLLIDSRYDLNAIVGFIPNFLSESDDRPAREQLNTSYAHGGGWVPFRGFKFDPDNFNLTYPGDPPLQPLAFAHLGDETIYVYPHAWVLILQPDGSFEVSRMD